MSLRGSKCLNVHVDILHAELHDAGLKVEARELLFQSSHVGVVSLNKACLGANETSPNAPDQIIVPQSFRLARL